MAHSQSHSHPSATSYPPAYPRDTVLHALYPNEHAAPNALNAPSGQSAMTVTTAALPTAPLPPSSSAATGATSYSHLYSHQHPQYPQHQQCNMASSYHHAAQAVHSYNNHPPPTPLPSHSLPDVPAHTTGGSSSSASASASASTSIKRRRPYYEVQHVHDPSTGRSREVIVIDGDSGEPPPPLHHQHHQQQPHSPYLSPAQHVVHLPPTTAAAASQQLQQAQSSAANARPKRQLRPRGGQQTQQHQQQQVLDSPSQHPQLLSAALASTIGYSNGSGPVSTADPAYTAAPAAKRRRRDDAIVSSTSASATSVARQQQQQQPPYSLYTSATSATTNAVPVAAAPPAIPVPPPTASSSTVKTTASNTTHPPYDDKDGHYIVTAGDVLQNTYSILKQLGQGTFGKVAECIDLRHNRRVAVKIVRAIQKYHDAALGEIRILNTLRKNDPDNRHQCIQMLTDFDYRKHKCMVFPLLGPSLFDYLKDNQFQPFTLAQVREVAIQLIDSVAYLHRLKIIHTDLKPENILLLSAESITWTPLTQHFNMSRKVQAKPSSSQKILKSLLIKVIDFGSATFDNEYKSSVVSTRHYRAPEIMLELGWSFACDMWSVGCILVELLIGEALFQTHENIEHLAMMEMILGMFQDELVQRSRRKHSWFHQPEIVAGGPSGQVKVCKVHFPLPDTKRDAKTFVKSLKTLKDICEMQGRSRANMNVVVVDPSQTPSGLPTSSAPSPTSSSVSGHPPYIPPPPHATTSFSNFHSLVQRLLIFDPRHRLTAKQALQHPFFEHISHPLSRLPQPSLVPGHQHMQSQRLSPVSRYPSSNGTYGYNHAQQFAHQHQQHHSESPATSLGSHQPPQPISRPSVLGAPGMAVGSSTSTMAGAVAPSSMYARHHHLAAPIGPVGPQGSYGAYAGYPSGAIGASLPAGPYTGASSSTRASYYDASAEARRAHLQQQLAMETGFALDEDDAPSALSTDSYGGGGTAAVAAAPPSTGYGAGYHGQPPPQHLYNQAMVHAAAAAAVMQQQHHGGGGPGTASGSSTAYYQQHAPPPQSAPAGNGYYSPHHRPASAFASLPSSAVASPLLINHNQPVGARPGPPSSALSPRMAGAQQQYVDPNAHQQASYMYSSAAAAAAAAAAYANASGYAAPGAGYDYGGSGTAVVAPGAPLESMRYSVSSLGATSGGGGGGGPGSDLGTTSTGVSAGGRGYYPQAAPQQGYVDGYQQQQQQQQQYRGYM